MDMEASTSYQLRSSSKPVQESHLDLLKRGTLSDVTFIVGPTKESIQCHQAFLVARSSVFEVMFSERWNQVSNKEIPLEDIDPKIFKKFLQFIYTDVFVANLAEALELLQVAHTYDVQLLVSKCEEFLLANEVPLNDALDVFLAARKYEMVQLMDEAVDSMAKRLPELRSHPSFSRMDKETLIHILKRNCLNMREVELFRLTLKWAKQQQQQDLTLEQSLEDILPLIRFPAMSLEEFTRTVVPTGLLPQSTLVEIFTYFGTDAETKKSMASTLKFNTQKRRLIDSVRYVDLYSGDLAIKTTKLVQLEKLVDSIQISTRFTGSAAMGISGVRVYCPSTVVCTASRSVASTFKEFKIVLKAVRRNVTRGPPYRNLLSMSPVKAAEGKLAQIMFDDVVPVEDNVDYRITIEEIQPTSTQPETRRKNYYVPVVFCLTENSEITLALTNNSVFTIKRQKMAPQESLGNRNEHAQLICGFSVEEL